MNGIRHTSHSNFLPKEDNYGIKDMYSRDLNNNENYTLTDSSNHLYPKSIALASKDEWAPKERQPLGAHTPSSFLTMDGGHHIDPLKYSSNNYKEVKGIILRQ